MTDRGPRPEDLADDRIRAWLDDKPMLAPRALVEATMAPIPAMAQRRRSLVAIGRMRVEVATLVRFAAAAALVVAVVGAVGLVRTPSGPGGRPSPSAGSSSTPAPLPSGVRLTNDGPLGAGSGSEPAVAGTYQSRLFRPTIRFTVPAGWSGGTTVRTFVGGSESSIGLPLTTGRGGIVFTVPTSIEPPAPGDPGATVPADLFSWILTNPNLALGTPTAVTIGGVPGRAVAGSLSASAAIDPNDDAYRIVDDVPLFARQAFRLAVVTVDGRQLLVATVANSSDFAAFSAEADAVLASVVFPDR
jgi:hypothetical protein